MDNTLKTRAITATIFSIVVLMLLYYNEYTRLLLFSIIGLGASYELLAIRKTNIATSIFILIILAMSYIGIFLHPISNQWFLIFSLFLSVAYIIYARCLFTCRTKILGGLPYSIWVYPGGSSLLVINRLSSNDNHNTLLIFGIIILIWLNDTFAYLVGRKLGKRKLYPRLSPKKTWEGFYGGGFATILGAFLLYIFTKGFSLTEWISIGVLSWTGGIVGDLTQSGIKRHYGVKDTGTILPGHGGFFDRFDSLIFVIPFVYLILNLYKFL